MISGDMGTEINFYQLDDAAMAHFLAIMLGKLYQEQSERMLFFSLDEALLVELDEVVWSFSKTRFIPHATIHDRLPERQPILLTDQEQNLNTATILLTTGGNTDAFLQQFSKVLYIFANKDPQGLETARQAWKHYKELDYALKYFYQTPAGGWQQKML